MPHLHEIAYSVCASRSNDAAAGSFSICVQSPTFIWTFCIISVASFWQCNFSTRKDYMKSQFTGLLSTNKSRPWCFMKHITDIVIDKMLMPNILTTIPTSNLPMNTLPSWQNIIVPLQTPQISEFQLKAFLVKLVEHHIGQSSTIITSTTDGSHTVWNEQKITIKHKTFWQYINLNDIGKKK